MLKTQIDEKQKRIELLKKEIMDFDNQSEEIVKKIEKENALCRFNKEIIAAYNSVR